MDLQSHHHPKQFVRVNVHKPRDGGGGGSPEERHFGVDPDTITLERLRHLIARALDVRGDFTVSFLRKSRKRRGSGEKSTDHREECVPLSCDWDLEGFLSEGGAEVDLALRMEPREPGLEEWDVVCAADVPVDGHEASRVRRRCPGKLHFLEQVFRPRVTSRPPLSEPEFRSLADWPGLLRHALYRCGGAEPRLRPQLWLHLLDVYPTGCGGREREAFLNRRAEEYYGLRHRWKAAGAVPSSALREVARLVPKDVVRTDRTLPDLDERALYNVLATYALHHPSTGYRQGMGDLLSPLLRVMRTEALAYVAFCGLMRRMRDNFRPDGRCMRTKFRHLRRLLRAHDPPLHHHLGRAGALELLFCYRWLLLDLKREFPHGEMPRLAEVLWSTQPPLHSDAGVELYEEGTGVTPPSSGEEEDDVASTSDEGGGGGGVEKAGFRTARRRRRKTRSLRSAPSVKDDDPSEGSSGIGRRGSRDSNYGTGVSGEEDEDPPSRGRSEGYTSGHDSSRTVHSTTDDEEDEDGRRGPPFLLPSPSRLGDGKPFLLFVCLALLTGQRDAILGRRMDAGEIGVHFDAMVGRHRLRDVMPEARERYDEYLRAAGWTEEEDEDHDHD